MSRGRAVYALGIRYDAPGIFYLGHILREFLCSQLVLLDFLCSRCLSTMYNALPRAVFLCLLQSLQLHNSACSPTSLPLHSAATTDTTRQPVEKAVSKGLQARVAAAKFVQQ